MMVWSWVASLTITLSRFCAAWHFAMLCGSLFLHWHACHRLCNEHSEESGASSNALTTHWEKNQSHIRKSNRASGTQLQISQEIMYMINAIVFFLIKINNQLSLDLRFCDMFAKARFIFNFKKNLFIFYFTILYWFCHISTWIHHWCTRVPNPEPPSHLPPCTIPLGYPTAPAPSIMYPASNLDWQFVSYMILYMFQCHSPKSSHPLPLPQSPKDYSIHLCLFCCLAYRVTITNFLNSIYMR